MVIDDRRKVIFIHIPKTGGVSVEKSIHKALGGNDNISYNKLMRIQPRLDVKTCQGLSIHSTLKDYRRYFGPKINEFYKFSIVRNPWRRMVSHYEYLITPGFNRNMAEENKMDFSTFIQVYKTRLLPFSIHGYKDFLEDDYGTKLNKVIKLESINTDLPQVGLDVKLDISEVLHMNSTDIGLKEHDNWRDYYNPGLKNMVYQIYKDDIIQYDYEFDE